MVKQSAVVCYFVPVILTQKGNPLGINSLADMLKPGVRIGQGDEKAAAVGRVTMEMLKLNGIDENAWKSNVVMNTPTVNELGVAIKLQTIDAAIVWDAVASKYKDSAEIIVIDPAKTVCPEVGAAVLTLTKDPETAKAFLDYICGEEAKEILRSNGYTADNPKK